MPSRTPSGWQRRFHEPITVEGRTLRTLREAADFIVELPETTSRQAHWQIVVRHLMLAAERNGIVWLAEVAMLQAINYGIERVVDADPNRKRMHWGKRQLKRDQ